MHELLFYGTAADKEYVQIDLTTTKWFLVLCFYRHMILIFMMLRLKDILFIMSFIYMKYFSLRKLWLRQKLFINSLRVYLCKTLCAEEERKIITCFCSGLLWLVQVGFLEEKGKRFWFSTDPQKSVSYEMEWKRWSVLQKS